MTHVKALIVDDLWTVVGTTNGPTITNASGTVVMAEMTVTFTTVGGPCLVLWNGNPDGAQMAQDGRRLTSGEARLLA